MKPNPLILKKIIPRKITPENFKKYGYVICWQGPEKKDENNQFRIVVRERKVPGWRIAYLIVRDKQVTRMEQHPFSLESFEPVKGRAVLFVTRKKDLSQIQAFWLDQPVVLRKGIWHNVASRGKEAHVKITENNVVKMIRLKLGYALS